MVDRQCFSTVAFGNSALVMDGERLVAFLHVYAFTGSNLPEHFSQMKIQDKEHVRLNFACLKCQRSLSQS